MFYTAFIIFDKNIINLKKLFFLFLIFLSCRNDEVQNNNDLQFLKEYEKVSNNKKSNFLDSVFLASSKIKVDSIRLKVLFSIAAEHFYIKNNEASRIVSKKAFEIAAKQKDSLSIGRALYYIGDCYMDYQKDSAYYYYKESEKIFKKINNADRLAKVLYNKAYLLFYEGNYVESEIEVAKALQYLKMCDNILYLYRSYSLQGSNQLELGEYDKALEYFELSAFTLKKMEKQNISKDEFYDYNITNIIDICIAYDKKGEYSKSIKLLKDVVASTDFHDYPKLYYSVLGNLAYSLMKNKQYSESKDYYNEAIKLAKKENDELGYLYKIVDFGEFHLLTKDTVKSRALFKEAIKLSKKLKNGKEILKTLNFLSIVDPSNASNYKSDYIRINDSIIKKQRENREKFTRIEFETEKVVEENKILSDNNLLLLLGLLIAIAIFLIILIIRNKNSRRKELDLIQQKEKANKELHDLTKEFQTTLLEAKQDEQKKLSKELHDGIVNKIYGIRMILGSLNKLTDEESKNKRLEYLKELHKLETEIRTLSHYLNSDFTKYIGEFNFLIEQLVQNNNDIGNVTFSSSINTTIDWNNYSSVIKINVYRILQELFLNVNKYANAKNCTLSMNEIDNQLIVEVKDDGKGFDVNDSSFGIGLQNCLERANTINAKFEIQSEVEMGTSVCLKVQLVQS